MEPRLNEWIMALLVQAKRGTYWPISCPLPVEPLFGRDPIHPPIILQEMISPRHERHYWTWQEPNSLPHRAWTSLWCDCVPWQSEFCDRLVCALQMHLKKKKKKKNRAWYAGPSDTSIHYLSAHNYIFLLIFKCMPEIPWKELVFELKPCRSRLIQGVNWASTAIIPSLKGCACVKFYHLGEGEMFFDFFFFLFSFFSNLRPFKKKKKYKKTPLPLTSCTTGAKTVSLPSEAGAEMSIRISQREDIQWQPEKKVPSFMCQPQRCGRTSLLTSWWSSWTILPCTHRLQFNIH